MASIEQKDYLLREIEKIGIIMSSFRQKLFGGKGNLAITPEKQIEDLKGMLSESTNFDLDKFLSLKVEDSNEYILSFKGFSIENIELLADCISQTGFSDKSASSKEYLEKALKLYELCNLKSRTYSFTREANILKIKNKIYLR